MRYRFITSLTVLSLSLLTPLAPSPASAMETAAKQAIVLDYDTGAVLLDKNATEKMPTSSMSKVMSMLVIFDALKAEHLKLDDTFVVSEKAWRKGGSKMFVEVDKQVKIEDLIRGVIIQSGNDATIVLAEGLAGTEDAFANLLNKKAAELGMENSQFKNASGWPDPDHYSTAQDLAIMAKALIDDHPQYYGYYAEKDFTYNDIKQDNRNPLLYRDIGADGIKTGHTEAGGYGLVGSGLRDGRRVIVVVNGLESAKDRASESAALLSWGLQSFKNETVFTKGDVAKTVAVSMGKAKTVPLLISDDVTLTIPKFSAEDHIVSVKVAEPLTAPITKGQQIGEISIEVPDYYTVTRPLMAGESVEELGFFWKSIENIRIMFLGQ